MGHYISLSASLLSLLDHPFVALELEALIQDGL